MSPDPVLITTGRVAKMLDVTPSTVTRWAGEGKLQPVVLPSGRFKFRLEDIEKILQGAGDAA
jgi:predicted site-specific integrase-resolvase